MANVNRPRLWKVRQSPDFGVWTITLMKKYRLSCVFVGVISIAEGCSAPSPVWDGTWKLNQSQSNIPGPSFSITTSAAGEYHIDNGTNSYSFRCNGKEYLATPHQTISCMQASDPLIDVTTKANGKTIRTSHWELSADGKVLTIKRTTIEADGSAKAKETVYSRMFPSVGFAGDWRDTKRLETGTPLLLAMNKRTLHIVFPESGQYADPPLDGSDTPMHGPGIPQGLTIAIRPHGPREFLTLKKSGGQVINQGSLSLSADGNTLVEQYWRPNRREEKATL